MKPNFWLGSVWIGILRGIGGGIECFRVARKKFPATPHILGFGDEKVTKNGQKQKVFASDKPVFSNIGSLARQHFRLMFGYLPLKTSKNGGIISENHQMWQ